MSILDKQKLNEALAKKALGYTATEQNEEYAFNEGDLVLVKKKITVKEIPPELAAIKMLMEQSGDEYSALTAEELEAEKQRLLSLLREKTETSVKEKENKKRRVSGAAKSKSKN